MAQPQFEVIKHFILNKIEQGAWVPGDGVPSENALAEQFCVSRMTARRALSELTDAGVLQRVRGAGTFVAEQLPTGSFLEIQSIDDEIKQRGHTHRARVLALESLTVDQTLHAWLQLEEGEQCYYSKVLHFENDVPIQLEERFINRALVPEYLAQDFSLVTPSKYLSSIVPLSEADHWIEAVRAEDDVHRLLKIKKTTPCLKISRRTYTQKGYALNSKPQTARTQKNTIVNFAMLYHPGDRYRLGGHLNY